jgi:hypothetical protein
MSVRLTGGLVPSAKNYGSCSSGEPVQHLLKAAVKEVSQKNSLWILDFINRINIAVRRCFGCLVPSYITLSEKAFEEVDTASPSTSAHTSARNSPTPAATAAAATAVAASVLPPPVVTTTPTAATERMASAPQDL